MRTILIVAGSRDQAASYAKRQGLLASDWQLLNTPEKANGLKDCCYIRVGTWDQLKKINDIIDALTRSGITEILAASRST